MHASPRAQYIVPLQIIMTHEPILTIRDLNTVFPDENGGLRALHNVSFDVHPREFICVLGPSGSGKTHVDGDFCRRGVR